MLFPFSARGYLFLYFIRTRLKNLQKQPRDVELDKLTRSLTLARVVLSCSCGDSGLYNLLVAFPHWQDHFHQHPGHQDDALLPVLQHLRPAALLPERLHQPHPLQPHFQEVPGGGLQAAAATPLRGKGLHHHQGGRRLHRIQHEHEKQVKGQPLGLHPGHQAFGDVPCEGKALPFHSGARKGGRLAGLAVFYSALCSEMRAFLANGVSMDREMVRATCGAWKGAREGMLECVTPKTELFVCSVLFNPCVLYDLCYVPVS